VGCTTDAGPCPAQPYKDLSDAELFAQDITLPFRFPLNDANSYLGESATFCTSGRDRLEAPYKYHAAEDYFQPAGTPVYAMADGEVSFSGPMGGYGWLIIIDHPQANIYSLYGHLSPSRWRLGTGPVSKGDLIAYLGDPHENGGSLKQPLKPHLHLGIRSGQRSDYPGNGEWRWMAGWIHPCPANLGWLRPSEVIAGQEIPGGGYPKPEGDFLTMWGVETLFGLIYSAGALGAFVYGTRKNTPIPLIMSGSIMLFAGWYFFKDGWRISPILFILAALLIIPGIKRFIAQRKSVI
jgi:murein DD-endopeptidase MepM/ murein hydrolase activator NlpD